MIGIIVVVVADVVIVVAVVVSFEVPKDLSHRLNHYDLPGREVHHQRRRRRRLIVVGVVIVCITIVSSCRWTPLSAAASDGSSGCHRGARRRWPCRLRRARTTRRRKLRHPMAVDWVVASFGPRGHCHPHESRGRVHGLGGRPPGSGGLAPPDDGPCERAVGDADGPLRCECLCQRRIPTGLLS